MVALALIPEAIAFSVIAVVIAFVGGRPGMISAATAITRKAVEMVTRSTLFRGLPCHVVMVGADKDDARDQRDWARTTLEKAGFQVTARLRSGQVDEVLCGYREEHVIDLIVMGACGHSNIREFLVGSTTTQLIRQSKVPLRPLR